MALELSAESAKVLIAFGCYLVGVMLLGIVSHRYLQRGSFVKEYFLGNRGLGAWVLALSVAATQTSGGTFMGFPSLVYTHGWIMGLWVCSYMMVPLTSMAIMGKRINQVARVSGAVTMPDVFRDRFQSQALGILSTLLILLFLTFNLVGQFKAGGLVMKEAMQLPAVDVNVLGMTVERGYLIGLVIFAFTVIAYTTYGGFWAVTWTDVLEGLVMLVGVVVMAVLAIQAVPPIDGKHGLAAATEHLRQQSPELVYGPGPGVFLPLGLAFSFFCMWSFMSPGQPSNMVRMMSFKDSPSLRRALLLVSGYYMLTYLCLLIIFICARAIFPTQYLGTVGQGDEPDSIMPIMIRHVADPIVAGLLLAAPYAAIMSTVAAFLLLISSSLVRDLYQRTINPNASTRTMKTVSYTATALVGLVVLIGAIHRPRFLQYIIVFTASGQGCTFLAPMVVCLYWRRATRGGILAGMLGGFLTLFSLYALGWLDNNTQDLATPWARWVQATFDWLPGWGEKRLGGIMPLRVGGLDPLVWGLLASAVLSVGVSLCTKVDEAQVRKYFA